MERETFYKPYLSSGARRRRGLYVRDGHAGIFSANSYCWFARDLATRVRFALVKFCKKELPR